MKRSGTTLIFVIVWAAVLFASFVIGICIKEVRDQRAKVESTTAIEPETSSDIQVPSQTEQLVKELAERRPIPGPGGAERLRNLSPEQRPGLEEGRRGMRERFANMSEEEREQFRAQMRERFAGRRREGGMRGRFENMSEEERARLREERERMRERWENMSEEEREEYRVQMRERSDGRRPAGGGQGGRPDAERQEND